LGEGQIVLWRCNTAWIYASEIRGQGTDDKGRNKRRRDDGLVTLVLRQRRLQELDLELLDVAAVVDEDEEGGRLREGGRESGGRELRG